MTQRLDVALVALSDCLTKCIEAARGEERERCARIARDRTHFCRDDTSSYQTAHLIAQAIEAKSPGEPAP